MPDVVENDTSYAILADLVPEIILYYYIIYVLATILNIAL